VWLEIEVTVQRYPLKCSDSIWKWHSSACKVNARK